jgi:hypothetical protein
MSCSDYHERVLTVANHGTQLAGLVAGPAESGRLTELVNYPLYDARHYLATVTSLTSIDSPTGFMRPGVLLVELDNGNNPTATIFSNSQSTGPELRLESHP